MATQNTGHRGQISDSLELGRDSNGVLINIKVAVASIRTQCNRNSKSSDGKTKRRDDCNEGVWNYNHPAQLQCSLSRPRYSRNSLLLDAGGRPNSLAGVYADDDLTLEEFFKLAETVLLEYYVHGSTREVAERLDDILTGPMRPYVASVAVEISLGHKGSQRELTSMLISDLYGRVLTGRDIERGFAELLRNLPDLMLDTPTAPTLLGNFMARAIADDCLPPKFVIRCGAETELSEPALAALDHAHALLDTKQGWVHLNNVWGVGGPMHPVTHLTQQIQIILKRYLSSENLQEVLSSIRALEVPHFHHEIVFAIIVMLLESLRACTALALCDLLKALDKYCVVSRTCMELGFRRVIEELPEIVLDVPTAYIIFGHFMQRCYCAGLIAEELLYEMPLRHSSPQEPSIYISLTAM